MYQTCKANVTMLHIIKRKRGEMTPNPGSPEAVEQGCTCPILDNGHGDEYLGQTRGFWITEDCPLHNKSNKESEAK